MPLFSPKDVWRLSGKFVILNMLPTQNSQRDISHLDKQTVEGAAGAVASIIAASFLNQWILGYQSFYTNLP